MHVMGAEQASHLLWERWTAGRRLAGIPAEMRPASRADGYAVQAMLERRTAHPLFGWKIAATSTAGQKHINVDGPLAGRLLKERAFESGATVPFGHNHMRVAEAEFALHDGTRPHAPLGPHHGGRGARGHGLATPGHRDSRLALRRLHAWWARRS